MKIKREVTEVTMPAGDYYVGDPCYTVPDELWMPWLEAANYETENVLAAEVEGHPVVGIGGFGGDGCYAASDGEEYPVDAGLLGLVPVALADLDPERRDRARALALVTRRTFTDPIRCRLDADGTVRLGDLIVWTN